VIVLRTMSTQHPDNVTTPFFATGALLTPDDEGARLSHRG